MKFEVECKHLDLKMSDGICDAFLAQPKADGKYPAVLFLMDAFGLRSYLSEMAEQLASEGFIVLQPNILYREHRSPMISLKFPLKLEDMPQAREQIVPLVRKYDPELGLKDAEVFLGFLSSQKNFNGKIATTGYCMGGSLSLRIAARYPDRIQAAASFHAGGLGSEAPSSPHLLLPKIKGKVFVAHADNDQSMPQEQIEKFDKAFSDANLEGRTTLYRGAVHGFTMKDLPAYYPKALEQHWTDLLNLIRLLQN